MEKPTFNEQELAFVKKYIAGEFNAFTAEDEERKIAQAFINRADDYALENNLYDEVGDDLVAWFAGKCGIDVENL